LCDPFTAHWPSLITPTNVCTGAVAFAGAFCGLDCADVGCEANAQTKRAATPITTLAL
jgi:hypothetical protein